MRNALDQIEDYGERVGPDGKPIDEFGAVLMLLPVSDDFQNPDLAMLAGVIANHRCSGRGLRAIRRALAGWRPLDPVMH